MPNMKAAALDLAARGWPVFPCNPDNVNGRKGKEPLIRAGFKGATTDPVQVAEWWDRWPNALIGMVPGRAGLLIVDLDPDDDEAPIEVQHRLEELIGEALPAVPRVSTQSGGWHLYFAKPDGMTIGNGKPLPDVDIRCDNGYVIVPPSRMANGNEYLWDQPFDGAFVDAPAALIELITRPATPPADVDHAAPRFVRPAINSEDPGEVAVRRYARAALDRAAGNMATTAAGGRGSALNATAFSMGHFVAAGVLSEREVVAALQDAADASGLTKEDGAKERDAKIMRGLSAGARAPGDIPQRMQRIADEARQKARLRQRDREGSEPAGFDEFQQRFAGADEGAASDDTPAPPIGDDGAIDAALTLTPKQWEVLERCADLDENDADNAKRLIEWFGSEILHVHEAGWFAWTGTHWDSETGRHATERYAHRLIAMIKREAALIVASPEEQAIIDEGIRLEQEHPKVRDRSDDVKAAIKLGTQVAKAVASRRHARYQFAVRSGDRSRTNAMIDQAEPHKSVLPKVMDTEDYALNTMSGTLRFTRKLDLDCPDPDVRRYVVSRHLDPHRPEDLISKVTAAHYRPDAVATRFLRDFQRYMPDPAIRELLQVAIGYSALGTTGEQVFFFHYGDGQNFKTTFVQATGRALGSYTKPMNFASVSGQNSTAGDKANPDWARLPGVRYLTIEEVPKQEPLKEDLIKMVTSGSDMPVRHLHKGLFDMRTTFTAHMLSNGEPNINSADRGIWRRTLIIKWDFIIPDAERLPFDQVMAMYDEERDGILNWIIEGIEKYLAHGLKPYITPEMRAFASEVRRDRDAVGSFVEDCVLEAGEDEFVTARTLYRGFQRWCGANGVDPVPTETAFGKKIKRVPVGDMAMEKRKRSVEGVKRFYGIRLHNVPADDTSFGAPPS